VALVSRDNQGHEQDLRRLRLEFPCENIVPSVTVHEEADTKTIMVLLVTDDSLAYRLTFRAPFFFNNVGNLGLDQW